MQRYIPLTIQCANDDCPMAEKCLRHMEYLETKKKELTLKLLNTSLLDITSQGCEYLHLARQVTEARGFQRIYDSMPKKMSRNLWQELPYCNCRRQFYRMLHGEVPLYPEQQQKILAFFASRGADTTLGFDSYAEVTI